MIPEVQAQARKVYSLRDVCQEAAIDGNIKTIIKVGYAPVREQARNLQIYFLEKGFDPVWEHANVIKINDITIQIVNAMRKNWIADIAGYANFIKT